MFGREKENQTAHRAAATGSLGVICIRQILGSRRSSIASQISMINQEDMQ